MGKLKKIIVVVIMLCLPLSGCYDATEIDEEVYALAIGVDKGVNNAIRVTFQYATYKDGGGGAGGGGGGGGGEDEESGEVTGTIVATVEAASLLEGINLINAAINRQISLMHAKMLVLSEDYARAGVGEYVEPLARFRDVRELMRVVVCKGKAEDFIKENKTIIGSSASKALELMFEQSKNSGYFPDTIFSDFYVSLLTPYGQPTAIYAGINDYKELVEPENNQDPPLRTEHDIEPGQIPRKGGTKKEMFGTAVFDGDRMVGSLSQNESRLFLLSIGEFRRGFFTFEDQNKPGLVYVLEVQLGRPPKVNAKLENDKVIINQKIILDLDVISIQSRNHYETLENITEFEQEIGRYFEGEFKKLIEKTQELNTDIFYFGKKVAGNFRTIDELENYNWKSSYKDAKVNVTVEANLRRSGFIYGATPIRSTEGKKGEEEPK